MEDIFKLLKELEQKPIYNKYNKEINTIDLKIKHLPLNKFYEVIFYKEGKIIHTFYFKNKTSVSDLLKCNLFQLTK